MDRLREILDRPAREERAGQVRRLRLRLGETEALDPSRADSLDLQSLEIGILNALADAFGFGTVAYRQFSAAGEFGVDHSSQMIDVGTVRNAQRRAVALLRRAIQTKEEQFEDKYRGHSMPVPPQLLDDSAKVSSALDGTRLDQHKLDGEPVSAQADQSVGVGSYTGPLPPLPPLKMQAEQGIRLETEPDLNRGDPRIAMAGLGQAGAMIAGFTGDRDADPTGVNVRVDENALFGFAEAAPLTAYDLLQARIAVLEAALSAPKPLIEKPIGPGHNGPPDFDPPMSEDEIKALVDVFREQSVSPSADLPKLAEIAKSAEVKAGQFRKRVDDFTDAVIKGAGGELGKKLVQIPWWTAVYAALSGVLDAASAWILSLPL
jgi:hypothetical protein